MPYFSFSLFNKYKLKNPLLFSKLPDVKIKIGTYVSLFIKLFISSTFKSIVFIISSDDIYIACLYISFNNKINFVEQG
jgi:hypothetical protein